MMCTRASKASMTMHAPSLLKRGSGTDRAPHRDHHERADEEQSSGAPEGHLHDSERWLYVPSRLIVRATSCCGVHASQLNERIQST